MDVSKKYIEMCEKAEEIQAERILGRCEFGDLFYLEDGFAHGGKCRFIGSYDGYETDDGYSIIDKTLVEESIWLPRQDQLQDLHGWKFDNQATRFWEWASEFNPETKHLFSWEQFWLGFVMKEKYNKVWDGKIWVK